MTSLTWSFESGEPLIGCGVDCETIDRFDDIASSDAHPMPFAFTRSEIDHARRQGNTARALCVSYTCKEALLKALGRPFDFRDCEILAPPDDGSPVVEQELNLDTAFKRDAGLSRAVCRCGPGLPGAGDIVTTVFLFGAAHP